MPIVHTGRAANVATGSDMVNWFAAMFGEAVADIRREVVERGTWGRPSARGQETAAKPDRDRDQPVAEKLGWDRGPEPQRGMDIDR